CHAIELGATYRHACNYAGISYQTFLGWMRTNATFHDAIKEAEGKATVGWLARIEKAASEGNWTAAAWKLERRYPNDYGRRDGREGLQEAREGEEQVKVDAEAVMSKLRALTGSQDGPA
ncbi:MAG: hypothetical protein EBR34_16285, partial [Sphingomonadaceae bacterium]|nr:hypothetical protein [Sphingomonadaceae bacterium]